MGLSGDPVPVTEGLEGSRALVEPRARHEPHVGAAPGTLVFSSGPGLRAMEEAATPAAAPAEVTLPPAAPLAEAAAPPAH